MYFCAKRLMTKDKIFFKWRTCKNWLKTTEYLNELFTSVVRNLDVKGYKKGSDPVVNNTTKWPILKCRKQPNVIAN